MGIAHQWRWQRLLPGLADENGQSGGGDGSGWCRVTLSFWLPACMGNRWGTQVWDARLTSELRRCFKVSLPLWARLDDCSRGILLIGGESADYSLPAEW